MLLLRPGEFRGEIVVIDTLPGFVRGTPRAAVAAVVEVGGSGSGIFHDVVSGVIADPATIAAVEVEKISRRDDNVVAPGGKLFDVVESVIPGLHDDVLWNPLSVDMLREEHVFPIDETAVFDFFESRDGLVNVFLEQVTHRLTWMFGEPLGDIFAEFVAIRLQFITTEVMEFVLKEVSNFFVELPEHLISLVIGYVKLPWVGLESSVMWEEIVGPPGISTSH
ncbi:hypothetical protein H106_08936 [Trichophyton rubrum CBS 735.88]|nr:hypothetical protein H106_08936 [Trichophyton rubrum CBS 735.88]